MYCVVWPLTRPMIPCPRRDRLDFKSETAVISLHRPRRIPRRVAIRRSNSQSHRRLMMEVFHKRALFQSILYRLSGRIKTTITDLKPSLKAWSQRSFWCCIFLFVLSKRKHGDAVIITEWSGTLTVLQLQQPSFNLLPMFPFGSIIVLS